MSNLKDDFLYPVVRTRVEDKLVTILPNDKLGLPQMLGIQVNLETPIPSANQIRLVIPVETAKDFHAALGAALLRH